MVRAVLCCTVSIAACAPGCGSARATNADALRAYRAEAHFAAWAEHVEEDRLTASRAIVVRLIDELLALGAEASGSSMQAAFDRAVVRFNELDPAGGSPWITTIEREDIGDVLARVAALAGHPSEIEELLRERDW